MFRIIALLSLPMICLGQGSLNGERLPVEKLNNEISPNELKRNASFNLDEIKVRWKKAALENCTGVPCVSFSTPGPVTSIVATVTGPTSASVSFVPPASDGGSPITGYRVTATTNSSAPAKRKSSATITVEGTSSPISVPGLTTGANYIFTVVAINAAGGSTPAITVTPVTPCTLNRPDRVGFPTLLVGSPINLGFGTTGATGIGEATGLPPGLTVNWLAGGLNFAGTPTVPGTFSFTIPLTGGCDNVNVIGNIEVVGF